MIKRSLQLYPHVLQWYASYEEVPRAGEPGKERYPTGCSGWLWVTSPGTARALAEAAQQVSSSTLTSDYYYPEQFHSYVVKVTFFWIDDVWVTGYLAKHLGIKHQDCIKYWTMKRDQLLLHKVEEGRN